ncbi:ribosome biogenesis GTPase YlqF [Halobacillus trueperi]|uniref:Ribosome biogenesis GTPase A n=2 Tax=Halobacillus TaxID=45667 RepID=A0A1H0MXH9_HALAD|nr:MULTISPECIES: ribosome biogenesis GTPase YlqF [Halobacillus]RDY72175.1 ribosome biogenesis GTPase YlqF [Halobacillus trueperi]SDO85107.1 ribosome biogenesis GTPase A [Halobacillus aidingensis]
MTIQWFPGHMAKAKREVAEKLKLVDFVIELVDARAPLSSQNPMLHNTLQEKPKMMVLMKKDLADTKITSEWIEHFKEKGIPAVAIEANQKQDVQKVVQQAKELGKEKMDKLKAKGIRPRASRAMIIGIPNVGKSTLINRLANKKMAKTGDKPGVTTKQQWIKVKKEFELLDTPGILWPKFEEEEVGYRLAAIGTIKDQILPKEDVAAYVLHFLHQFYPDRLEERFGLENVDDMMEAFESIGKKRGCLESGGRINFEKVSDIILQDLRTGKLGMITLERPDS